MSLIHRSNVAATGAILGSATLLSKTAAELYAGYKARVEADGGTVADEASALAAITSAISGGYYLATQTAVAPRWGRRISGGNITKLYSLIGTCDFVAVGTMQNDTTTAAFPMALSAAGAYFECADAVLVKGSAFALLAVGDPAVGGRMDFSISGVTGAAYPLDIDNRQAGLLGKVNVTDSLNVVKSSPNVTKASAYISYGAHVDLAANNFTVLNDAVQVSVTTAANPLQDLRLVSRRYILNGIRLDSTMSSVGTGARVAEAWALHTSTIETASVLAAHQSARYAT